MNSTEQRRRGSWMIRIITTFGVLIAVWVYTGFVAEQNADECTRGGVPFKEKLFKAWLVSEWTADKGHRDDGTLLPKGTRVSDIETLGISDWGLVFYTAVGSGAAFDVYFDRYCDFKIVARQWCPNKDCSVVGRVRS